MSTFATKTFSEIYEDMKSWVIANQDKITDFNSGSIISSLLEAVANEIEEIYRRAKIGFLNYLPLLPFYAFGFSKIAGTKSAGSVVFSRNVSTASPITIPIGTIVSTSSGLNFVTTAEGTILANQTDSGSVSIQASDIGVAYNVPSSSVTTITTTVTGVDTVTNASSTTGGLDNESDDDFQTRFRQYCVGLGRSNTYGLVAGAMTVTNVRSVSPIEHFPPVSQYNVTLYIDDGAGNAPNDMIAAVLNVLLGDGTDTYPGYKAAGINLRVLAPTKVTIAVTATITSNATVDQAEITTNITDRVTAYINGLKIGEDVIFNEIVRIIKGVPGVYDLILTAPSSNTSISTSQIARAGTFTITYV